MLRKIRDAFRHIDYYDEPHKYFDNRNDKELISVTTQLKEYIPDFDEPLWAEQKAADYGISELDVLSLWHMQREYGTTKGSIIHDYLERAVVGKHFPLNVPNFLYKPAVDKCLLLAKQFVEQYHQEYYNIANELIVGNEKNAGQIDNLSGLLSTDDIILIDYKTDKSIEFGNMFSEPLHSPFAHMPNCEFSKYTLQTNFYRILFEQATGFKISKIHIVWINENNSEPKWFDVPLDNSIKKII